MNAPSSGFDRFRDALHEAARRSLERAHPEYVATFQEVLTQTGDLSRALHAVKDIPTSRGFAKWQPLLTLTLDIELAIEKLRSALNLFKELPSREVLDMFSMSPGAWIDYHFAAWSFWLHGLLEREKKLVSRAVRTLIRPSNTQWKSIENGLLKPIDALREHTGKIRHPLAHGGGAVEAIEEERLWEVRVLLGGPLDIRDLFESRVQYHARWYERLRSVSVQAIAKINQVSEELNRNIDWDNIR